MWHFTTRLLWIGMVFVGLTLPGPSASAVVLVDAGEPKAVIVLPAEPEAGERQAADELVEHIELMSEVTLTVIEQGQDTGGLLPILIGAAADDALAERVMARQDELRDWEIDYRLGQGGDTFAFALRVDDEAVQLRGGMGHEGTRTAAYELLEQIGVRWYMPGEYGRVVPERDTVRLERQQSIQVPAFVQRREPRRDTGDPDYAARARLGGLGTAPGRHGFPKPDGMNHRELREAHPEYYALTSDGQRGGRQLCVSNREVIDLVARAVRQRLDAQGAPSDTSRIIDVGPHDGGGNCQCDDCRKLDAPEDVTTPFTGPPERSHTDRYVWFINRVLEELEDDYPNVRLGMYAYGRYELPPRTVEPNERMAISIAPIRTCRHHGPNNPACPESSYVPWLYEQWDPNVNEIWDRGYLYNLACPGLPISLVHRLREEVPMWYEMGVVGYHPDHASTFATYNPGPYIYRKLAWDHTADVDELLADFYERFYGPAAEPMAAYHTLLNVTHRDADHHTGASWDLPQIFPRQVRDDLQAHLAEAESLVRRHGDEGYATRLEITRKGFEYLQAYCDIIDRRNSHDFLAEKEALGRMIALRESLQNDYDAKMLDSYHVTFLERFIASITNAGYATLANGGRIVAAFSHDWQFQQDPEQWGQYIGLHAPASEGGNWQTIRTDTSWSNQGLRYYFGQTWSRQSATMPAEYEGETVHIWFAGVNRTAEVWVNGDFVGANHDGAEFDLDAHGAAFQPFEFDATAAINFGGENVITVRSYRPTAGELGTGGLVGPVMFYVPGE